MHEKDAPRRSLPSEKFKKRKQRKRLRFTNENVQRKLKYLHQNFHVFAAKEEQFLKERIFLMRTKDPELSEKDANNSKTDENGGVADVKGEASSSVVQNFFNSFAKAFSAEMEGAPTAQSSEFSTAENEKIDSTKESIDFFDFFKNKESTSQEKGEANRMTVDPMFSPQLGREKIRKENANEVSSSRLLNNGRAATFDGSNADTKSDEHRKEKGVTYLNSNFFSNFKKNKITKGKAKYKFNSRKLPTADDDSGLNEKTVNQTDNQQVAQGSPDRSTSIPDPRQKEFEKTKLGQYFPALSKSPIILDLFQMFDSKDKKPGFFSSFTKDEKNREGRASSPSRKPSVESKLKENDGKRVAWNNEKTRTESPVRVRDPGKMPTPIRIVSPKKKDNPGSAEIPPTVKFSVIVSSPNKSPPKVQSSNVVKTPTTVKKLNKPKSPHIVRSLTKVKSPVIAEKPSNIESPAIVEGPTMLKSPIKVKSPTRTESPANSDNLNKPTIILNVKSPTREKSPVIIENINKLMSAFSVKSPTKVKSPVIVENPSKPKDTFSVKSPTREKSPVIIENKNQQMSAFSVKSPTRVKSPVKTKNPNKSRSTLSVKSPTREKSPVIIENQNKQMSAFSVKSPTRVKSPVKTKNPNKSRSTLSVKSPTREKSPVIIENQNKQMSAFSVKSPTRVKSPVKTKNPNKSRSTLSVKSPTREKSPVIIENQNKQMSAFSVKSPTRVKSPVKTKNPNKSKSTLSVKSPTREKSPVIIENQNKLMSAFRVKSPARVNSPVTVEKPSVTKSPSIVEGPSVLKSPISVRSPTRTKSPFTVEDPKKMKSPDSVEKLSKINCSEFVEGPTILNSSTSVKSPTKVRSSVIIGVLNKPKSPVGVKSPIRKKSPAIAGKSSKPTRQHINKSPTRRKDPVIDEGPTTLKSPASVRSPASGDNPDWNSVIVEGPVSADKPTELKSAVSVNDPTSVESSSSPKNTNMMKSLVIAEGPTLLEDPSRDKIPTSVESPIKSIVKKPTNAKSPASVEIPQIGEGPTILNPFGAKSPTRVKSSSSFENQNKLKSPMRTKNPTRVKSPDSVENQNKIKSPMRTKNPIRVKSPVSVGHLNKLKGPMRTKNQTRVKSPDSVENNNTFKSPIRSDNPTRVKSPDSVEKNNKLKSPMRSLNPSRVKSPGSVENQNKLKSPMRSLNPSRVKSPGSVENQNKLKSPMRSLNPSRVKSPDSVENQNKLKSPMRTKNPTRVKSPVSVKNLTKVKSPSIVEKPKKLESPTRTKNIASIKIPVSVETSNKSPASAYNPTKVKSPAIGKSTIIAKSPYTNETRNKMKSPANIDSPNETNSQFSNKSPVGVTDLINADILESVKKPTTEDSSVCVESVDGVKSPLVVKNRHGVVKNLKKIDSGRNGKESNSPNRVKRSDSVVGMQNRDILDVKDGNSPKNQQETPDKVVYLNSKFFSNFKQNKSQTSKDDKLKSKPHSRVKNSYYISNTKTLVKSTSFKQYILSLGARLHQEVGTSIALTEKTETKSFISSPDELGKTLKQDSKSNVNDQGLPKSSELDFGSHLKQDEIEDRDRSKIIGHSNGEVDSKDGRVIGKGDTILVEDNDSKQQDDKKVGDVLIPELKTETHYGTRDSKIKESDGLKKDEIQNEEKLRDGLSSDLKIEIHPDLNVDSFKKEEDQLQSKSGDDSDSQEEKITGDKNVEKNDESRNDVRISAECEREINKEIFSHKAIEDDRNNLDQRPGKNIRRDRGLREIEPRKEQLVVAAPFPDDTLHSTRSQKEIGMLEDVLESVKQELSVDLNGNTEQLNALEDAIDELKRELTSNLGDTFTAQQLEALRCLAEQSSSMNGGVLDASSSMSKSAKGSEKDIASIKQEKTKDVTDSAVAEKSNKKFNVTGSEQIQIENDENGLSIPKKSAPNIKSHVLVTQSPQNADPTIKSSLCNTTEKTKRVIQVQRSDSPNDSKLNQRSLIISNSDGYSDELNDRSERRSSKSKNIVIKKSQSMQDASGETNSDPSTSPTHIMEPTVFQDSPIAVVKHEDCENLNILSTVIKCKFNTDVEETKGGNRNLSQINGKQNLMEEKLDTSSSGTFLEQCSARSSYPTGYKELPIGKKSRKILNKRNVLRRRGLSRGVMHPNAFLKLLSSLERKPDNSTLEPLDSPSITIDECNATMKEKFNQRFKDKQSLTLESSATDDCNARFNGECDISEIFVGLLDRDPHQDKPEESRDQEFEKIVLEPGRAPIYNKTPRLKIRGNNNNISAARIKSQKGNLNSARISKSIKKTVANNLAFLNMIQRKAQEDNPFSSNSTERLDTLQRRSWKDGHCSIDSDAVLRENFSDRIHENALIQGLNSPQQSNSLTSTFTDSSVNTVEQCSFFGKTFRQLFTLNPDEESYLDKGEDDDTSPKQVKTQDGSPKDNFEVTDTSLAGNLLNLKRGNNNTKVSRASLKNKKNSKKVSTFLKTTRGELGELLHSRNEQETEMHYRERRMPDLVKLEEELKATYGSKTHRKVDRSNRSHSPAAISGNKKSTSVTRNASPSRTDHIRSHSPAVISGNKEKTLVTRDTSPSRTDHKRSHSPAVISGNKRGTSVTRDASHSRTDHNRSHSPAAISGNKKSTSVTRDVSPSRTDHKRSANLTRQQSRSAERQTYKADRPRVQATDSLHKISKQRSNSLESTAPNKFKSFERKASISPRASDMKEAKRPGDHYSQRERGIERVNRARRDRSISPSGKQSKNHDNRHHRSRIDSFYKQRGIKNGKPIHRQPSANNAETLLKKVQEVSKKMQQRSDQHRSTTPDEDIFAGQDQSRSASLSRSNKNGVRCHRTDVTEKESQNEDTGISSEDDVLHLPAIRSGEVSKQANSTTKKGKDKPLTYKVSSISKDKKDSQPVKVKEMEDIPEDTTCQMKPEVRKSKISAIKDCIYKYLVEWKKKNDECYQYRVGHVDVQENILDEDGGEALQISPIEPTVFPIESAMSLDNEGGVKRPTTILEAIDSTCSQDLAAPCFYDPTLNFDSDVKRALAWTSEKLSEQENALDCRQDTVDSLETDKLPCTPCLYTVEDPAHDPPTECSETLMPCFVEPTVITGSEIQLLPHVSDTVDKLKTTKSSFPTLMREEQDDIQQPSFPEPCLIADAPSQHTVLSLEDDEALVMSSSVDHPLGYKMPLECVGGMISNLSPENKQAKILTLVDQRSDTILDDNLQPTTLSILDNKTQIVAAREVICPDLSSTHEDSLTIKSDSRGKASIICEENRPTSLSSSHNVQSASDQNTLPLNSLSPSKEELSCSLPSIEHIISSASILKEDQGSVSTPSKTLHQEASLSTKESDNVIAHQINREQPCKLELDVVSQIPLIVTSNAYQSSRQSSIADQERFLYDLDLKRAPKEDPSPVCLRKGEKIIQSLLEEDVHIQSFSHVAPTKSYSLPTNGAGEKLDVHVSEVTENDMSVTTDETHYEGQDCALSVASDLQTEACSDNFPKDSLSGNVNNPEKKSLGQRYNEFLKRQCESMDDFMDEQDRKISEDMEIIGRHTRKEDPTACDNPHSTWWRSFYGSRREESPDQIEKTLQSQTSESTFTYSNTSKSSKSQKGLQRVKRLPNASHKQSLPWVKAYQTRPLQGNVQPLGKFSRKTANKNVSLNRVNSEHSRRNEVSNTGGNKTCNKTEASCYSLPNPVYKKTIKRERTMLSVQKDIRLALELEDKIVRNLEREMLFEDTSSLDLCRLCF